MNKYKKYLIIAAFVYIILFIFYKFYIFNGAFEWFKYINTFYALLLFIGLIIYFTKLFGKNPESTSNVEKTLETSTGQSANEEMGSGTSNSGLVIAAVNLSIVVIFVLYTMIFGFDIYALVALYLILLIASLIMSVIASFLNKKSLIKKGYAIYLIWLSPIILFIALYLIISGHWVTTYN